MKCECERCLGTGEITCPECDGQGTYYGDIESFKLDRSMHNYDELVELQKDAWRVTRQADRLKEIKPHRAKSYDAQLRATLSIINLQAEQVAAIDPKRKLPMPTREHELAEQKRASIATLMYDIMPPYRKGGRT